MSESSRSLPILSLRDIEVRYGAARALAGVSLDVSNGEFLSFLGPSGSGKTTTLNVIAGFVTPSRGVVLQEEGDITATPATARGFGVVFQGYALFPHLSALDNVAYPLWVRGTSRTERRTQAARMLERMGLGALAERRPAELSGGQQQRVAMARALVFDPPVLLLDEPLSALDRDLRRRLQAELRSLHRDAGRTFILVTHDQEEAMTLSDRIAVFRAGQLVQTGTPQELYRRPISRFVAEFVGEANLFPPVAAGANAGGGSLLLRPEDLSLGRARKGRWAGALVDMVFAGDSWRVTLRDEAGRSWMARLSEAERSALSPLPGECLQIDWQDEAAWIIADDGQAQDKRGSKHGH
ncbi:ABC transporter ATP-binding protein [Labrys miyagiensis]